MAVRAEELLRVHLDQLSVDQFPADHPERRFVQAQADAFAAFNAARRNGLTPVFPEAPVLPTPESITAHWRERWTQWGARIGKTYDIPELNITPDKLVEVYQGGRKIVCKPKGITLVDLGRIFPDMGSWSTSEGTTVKSEESKGEYFAVEDSIDSPNLGSDEITLRDLFKAQGRKGMTLSTYIVASQDAKLETGQYFDGGAIWSRLLGSRSEGSVVYAGFDPGGGLGVGSFLDPRIVDPDLGGRSQEAIGA